MSIRAYLRTGTATAGSHPHTFHGYIVCDVSTAPYIIFDDSALEAPDELDAEIVAAARRFSVHTSFYGGGPATMRESGEYRLGTAKATVNRDGGCHHHLRVWGPSLEDVAKLSRRIRLGTIAPKASYERKQVRAGLPSMFEALHQLVESAARAYDRARAA